MRAGKIITDILVEKEVVEEERQEIVAYGLNHGLTILLNIGIVLVIGILVEQVLSSIIFLTFFSILRSYAGGYHAKSTVRCYIISILLMCAIIGSINAGIWNIRLCAIAGILSTFILIVIAPVENPNRKLDLIEREVFGKRACVVAIITLLLSTVGMFLTLKPLYESTAAALSLTTVLAVVGKITNLTVRTKPFNDCRKL